MKLAKAVAAMALAVPFVLPGSALAGGDGAKPGTKAPAGSGESEQKDWSSHKGNIPFIIGREAGMKEVEFTGKPILFFYTATW